MLLRGMWRRTLGSPFGLLLVALLVAAPTPAFALTATPSPTPSITPAPGVVAAFSAVVEPSTLELEVGQTLTVVATVYNQGSGVSFGLPQFRLRIQDQQGIEQDQTNPIVTPARPDPIVHYLGIGPGQSDSAVFTLQAARPGAVVLNLWVSGEVCVIGVPGCGGGYWSGAGATSRLITVRAAASPTPTYTPTPFRAAPTRTPVGRPRRVVPTRTPVPRLSLPPTR
ncbi:MAG: hypothetical protein OHK0022_13290 [Roseiflexaceae bacterium]